jgi:hypothetical protein
MKKIILIAIAAIAVIAIAAVNVNIASGDNVNNLAKLHLANIVALSCEQSVDVGVAIITVTVCDRETPWYATLLNVGVKCYQEAPNKSCTFTNVC